MKFRREPARETAREDGERTRNLMAALGASLDPDREVTRFEEVVGRSLYANDSHNPPSGHDYPRRTR